MKSTNSHMFHSNQEIAEVEKVIENKSLFQLVELIQRGLIWSIGAKAGFFDIDPTLTFNLVHFDVEDILGINPRTQDNQLLLDLWFHSDKTDYPEVLQERYKDGRRLILLTVVITEVDYISAVSNRYYW